MFVGGIRISATTTSGRVRSTAREQLRCICGFGADLDCRLGEHSFQPLPDEERIVGQGYAHGISAMIVVPLTRWAVHANASVERSDAVGEPGEARTARRVGSTDAVVADLDAREALLAA